MATSSEVRIVFADATAVISRLLAEASALEDLLAKGEEGRTDRSANKPIEVLEARLLGEGRIAAKVQGVEQVYHPRITFGTRRAFSCTCQDTRQRGRKVGPCKHTLALARYWLDRIQPDLDRVRDSLVNCIF